MISSTFIRALKSFQFLKIKNIISGKQQVFVKTNTVFPLISAAPQINAAPLNAVHIRIVTIIIIIIIIIIVVVVVIIIIVVILF